MSATAIAEWVLAAGVLVTVGVVWARFMVSSGRRGRLHLMAWRRAPLGRRTATRAALDDPVFAPERIEAAVAMILPQQLGRHARVAGRPRVDILGVVNRQRDSEDRVVVRVRADVDRGATAHGLPRRGLIDERWTLVHRGEGWHLAAGAGDPLAESLLSSPLIDSPGDDTRRLREASLQELSGDARRGGPGPRELTDTAAPPLQQLTDLSVADERFEPMLIEAAVAHIVEAWEQSSSGSDAPLLAVATGAGAHALNFPAPGRGRRRISDARVQRWVLTGLNASAQPPTVTVSLRVKATAWTDDDASSAGDHRPAHLLDLVWTLALDEATPTHPRWRLTHSADHS